MMKSVKSFQLTSEECELLLLFESSQSLQAVASAMGRDHSVVARSLKRIADRFPVVEKKAGKWILTAMGKSLNEGTRSAMQMQTLALNSQSSLRIGTNREFAARVLGPEFSEFQKIFPGVELTINAYQAGTEQALLAGQIDIGIDCDRPHDPDVGYKLVTDEKIVAVGSKSFIQQQRKTSEDFLTWPHLLCERLHPDKILASLENQVAVIAKFNDIAATRAACVQGVGWALLPYYAVRSEIEKGELTLIGSKAYGNSKYGVWWLRGRPYLKQTCEQISNWLARQDLSTEKPPATKSRRSKTA